MIVRRSPVKKLPIVLISLLIPVLSWAGGQHVIPDYDTAREEYFWPELYPDGGKSLYCDIKFDAGERLSVEHVLPASWMAKHHNCIDRNHCDVPDFLRAYGDLHNLWPADGGINSSRGNLEFKILPGETNRRFTHKCPDYERPAKSSTTQAFVEPQDDVKGDIARSLFYMHSEYEFSLKGMLPMLKKWNRKDKPDEHEHWRNEKIEEIQGTRNPFIDNYHLGNSL